MKPGDLVVYQCENDRMWYKGMIGLLVGFDRFGKFNLEKGDPLVMYGNGETLRLAGNTIEAVT